MTKRDYYEVLGLNKRATEKDIKRSYRKLAMKYHPDKYDGPKLEGEEKFKELNEAYSVLSDPNKKQRYDQFGHAGLQGGGSSAYNMDPSDFFSSIFGSMFGGSSGGGGGGFSDFGFGGSSRRQRKRGPTKGEDVVLRLKLTLEESYDGVSKKIKMPFNKTCDSCMGSRAETGSKMKSCAKCKGVGIVERQVRQGMFIQISQENCDYCKGSGEIPNQPCKTCKGSGRSNKREEITVKIPRGIDHGEAVRVSGKGRPSNNGGFPGDLIFRISLYEHEYFIRDGIDVYQKIKVDYPTLVLGGEIKVRIISGKNENNYDTLKVPAGTQYNDVLIIRNKGFIRKTRGNMVKGDMKYLVEIEIPKRVSKAKKKLLQDLKNIK